MRRFSTATVALALAFGPSGCRIFQKNSDSANSSDPLYGRYIPKQDLPVPSRDPLYTAPVSNTKSTASNSEPFRNTKATTVAGLAGNVKVEDTGMSLGDRRPMAEPATRGVPLRPTHETAAGDESWELYAAELRRLRARYDAPVREANGDYSIAANVPVGPDGAIKRFEGAGPSAAAAAKQLVEQIKSEDR